MVSKILFTIILLITLNSCNGQNIQVSSYASAEPVHIHRFDKVLFQWINSSDSTLNQSLKEEFSGMLDVVGKGILNIQTPDAPEFSQKLKRFYTEPTLNGLYRDAISQYDTVADIEQLLGEGFAYLKNNIPAMQIPAIYMHVSGFNQNVLVGDSLLSISIDKYMGSDYPLYQDFFYDNQKQKMKRALIAPDYLAGWLMSEFPFTGKDNILLDRMIYEGKIKYLISQALPEVAPETLMGYTETAYNWSKENEASIWKAIIERKHLYTPDLITTTKYFEETPDGFLSNEAPGNLGSWLGWQIIRKYMEETHSTPEALMKNNDAQDILTKSKYKP